MVLHPCAQAIVSCLSLQNGGNRNKKRKRLQKGCRQSIETSQPDLEPLQSRITALGRGDTCHEKSKQYHRNDHLSRRDSCLLLTHFLPCAMDGTLEKSRKSKSITVVLVYACARTPIRAR